MIDNEQLEAYSVHEVETIVFGYLAKTYGKVTASHYNKVMREISYPQRTAAAIKELADEIDADPDLTKLLDQVITGTIDVEKLPEDMLPIQEHLEENTLHTVISPQHVSHQKVLAANREFSKFQREGAWTKLLFDGVKAEMLKEFSKLDLPKYTAPVQVTSRQDRTLIVTLSDLHIGALVTNTNTGGYSFEVLLRRLEQYMQEATRAVELYQPKEIRCYVIGDIIEHINMRNVNQAFDSEFPATEQIAKATRVLADFLQLLEKLAPVKFGIVGGNHDRFQGNKNDKIYNDNVAYIALDTLLLLKQLGSLQNTEIIDNRHDIYSFEDQVQGKVVKVIHGDTIRKIGNNIPRFIKTHNIDYLLTGHIHNVQIAQEDFERMHIVVSSTMGANDYSKESMFNESSPSQTLIVLGKEFRGPIIYPVYLR